MDWRDFVTGGTLRLEGLCVWRDFATGETLRLEGLCDWKDFSFGVMPMNFEL